MKKKKVLTWIARRLGSEFTPCQYALILSNNQLLAINVDKAHGQKQQLETSVVLDVFLPSVNPGLATSLSWLTVEHSFLAIATDRGFLFATTIPSPSSSSRPPDPPFTELFRVQAGSAILQLATSSISEDTILMALDQTGTITFATFNCSHRQLSSTPKFLKTQKIAFVETRDPQSIPLPGISSFTTLRSTEQWLGVTSFAGVFVILDLLKLMSRWEFGIDTTFLTTDVLTSSCTASTHPCCRIPSPLGDPDVFPFVDAVLDSNEDKTQAVVAWIGSNATITIAKQNLQDGEQPTWIFGQHCFSPIAAVPSSLILGVQTLFVFFHPSDTAVAFLDLDLGLIPTSLTKIALVPLLPSENLYPNCPQNEQENLHPNHSQSADLQFSGAPHLNIAAPLLDPHMDATGTLHFWTYAH